MGFSLLSARPVSTSPHPREIAGIVCRPFGARSDGVVRLRCVHILRNRWGVGLASAIALAVLLSQLRFEGWQVELRPDMILAGVHVVARKAVHHETTIRLLAWCHRKR